MTSKEVTPELVRLLTKDIDTLGHTRAMSMMAGRVKDARNHPAIIEESPKNEPQSNRLAERRAHAAK